VLEVAGQKKGCVANLLHADDHGNCVNRCAAKGKPARAADGFADYSCPGLKKRVLTWNGHEPSIRIDRGSRRYIAKSRESSSCSFRTRKFR